jgi:predicted DNA binding CopG/RHH family protein
MPETRIFPDFKSEAEEAEWWDTHEDESIKAFDEAAKEGRLGRGTVARKAGLPTTTIRLDPVDIELARKLAEKRGLKYQTYLKMLIHEALTHEAESRELLTRESKAS